ncbi:hypothetical protein [Burkholderia cepacia]|uniref:hypothetical protein n=1 Tax=Burkholderia cepacia TaxID=292 RepID=UPI0026516B8C|nr:hypothetical protein [Burkholderia cepacia]MDN7616615.1 hypothetical protein [Burkholderia cepacia]
MDIVIVDTLWTLAISASVFAGTRRIRRQDAGISKRYSTISTSRPVFQEAANKANCVDRIMRGLRPRMILNPVYHQDRGVKAAARRCAVAYGQP